MIIFEPCDQRTSNLITELTPPLTFLLCLPPTRLPEVTAPTSTSLLHLGGRSPEVTMVTMRGPTRITASTYWTCRRTSHQEHPTPGTGVISFVCYLLTIKLFVKPNALSQPDTILSLDPGVLH